MYIVVLPAAALPPAHGCEVWVDFNVFSAADLLAAAASRYFRAAQGSWTILENSRGVSDAEWRTALTAVGADSSVSEDNPGSVNDCLAVASLVAPRKLAASFHYHETGGTPATMLNNSEIDAAFAACGGIAPIVTLTRAFWPGSDWRTRVEATLGNGHLSGVAMEFNPDDFGKRNEDEFVAELLSRGKRPIFLLPFRVWANTEVQMAYAIAWLTARGANISDDRVVFALANYDTPPLPVIGPTDRRVREGAVRGHPNSLASPLSPRVPVVPALAPRGQLRLGGRLEAHGACLGRCLGRLYALRRGGGGTRGGGGGRPPRVRTRRRPCNWRAHSLQGCIPALIPVTPAIGRRRRRVHCAPTVCGRVDGGRGCRLEGQGGGDRTAAPLRRPARRPFRGGGCGRGCGCMGRRNGRPAYGQTWHPQTACEARRRLWLRPRPALN